LMDLWGEYRAQVPDGYGYARFCQLYAEWKKRIAHSADGDPRSSAWRPIPFRDGDQGWRERAAG